MKFFISLAACALPLLRAVLAADEIQEHILAAVIFTASGQSSSLLSEESSPLLTPFGAQQLFGAGVAIRDRYVAKSSDGIVVNTPIVGISPDQLDNEEISVASLSEELSFASTQAFMQGLYPPLDLLEIEKRTFGYHDSTNRTRITYPLDGYQYANIATFGPQDPSFIELAGNLECPLYDSIKTALLHDDDMKSLQIEADAFYSDISARIMNGMISESKLHVLNADRVWQVLDSLSVYGEVYPEITPSDLLQARHFADKITFALNSRPIYTASHGRTREVAGKTLARAIAKALELNFETRGRKNKLSLMFGHVDPMMAFSSVAGLASDHQENFYGMPNPGASMVIELFSRETGTLGSYPESTNDLLVRFLLRNGTNAADPDNKYVPYPMFGLSPSNTVMPYNEFINRMKAISMNVAEWCSFCDSQAAFCPRPVKDAKASGHKKENTGLLIGGVIGAAISLALYCSITYLYRSQAKIIRAKLEARRKQDVEAQKEEES